MGVRTDFEEAIMELMSAMEVNVEDDLEGLLQRNSSETRGHCELKNLITNVNNSKSWKSYKYLNHLLAWTLTDY